MAGKMCQVLSRWLNGQDAFVQLGGSQVIQGAPQHIDLSQAQMDGFCPKNYQSRHKKDTAIFKQDLSFPKLCLITIQTQSS